jgi:hypothetical protein
VFGFVYPEYCFPARKQGGKRKIATLTSSGAPKPKKAKVLTRRLKLHSLEKTVVVPTIEKVKFIGSVKAIPLATETAPAMPVEASVNPVEDPGTKKMAEEQPKLLSPPIVTGLPKLSTTATTTLRKRRMASVLDAILESMKMPTPASIKALDEKIEDAKEVVTANAPSIHVEAGPSGAMPVKLVGESLSEKPMSHVPKAAPHGDLNYIVRHVSGKQLSADQIVEVQHYAKELKYPQGSLVYGGDNEDDFLYCLPYSKEINVCRELMDNMGYPKLELGLSAMAKDQLTDSLAYNNLKVCILWLLILNYFLVILIVIICSLFVCQGLILSKALNAQKDTEDESSQIAIGNLRSEVITLRNEALGKDKILLSLVERLKSSEARLSSLSEAE